MKVFLIILFLMILAASNALGCSLSGGASGKDKAIAREVCNAYSTIKDILMISVEDSLLRVDISRELYRSMVHDRITGNQGVRGLAMQFQVDSKRRRVVSVMLYVNGVELIRGQGYGRDIKVTYLDFE